MIELIIIDGKVKNCEVLFECNSVDDLASFKMIREGVEVTPDNAPTFDIFDIKLIAEPRSPYGFSSLFKRNPNIDEWEYMGFGHSGACSVVTALLKQLQRKEQECEELKKKLMQKSEVDMFFNTPVNGWSNNPCDICECKQALDDIEKYCNNQISLTGDLPFRTTKSAILDIISSAKGGE